MPPEDYARQLHAQGHSIANINRWLVPVMHTIERRAFVATLRQSLIAA